MIFEQHRAPFNNPISFGDKDKNNKPIKYFRIGIEKPHSIPLSEMVLDDSMNNYIVFKIIDQDGTTQKSYVLTERDVLEFSNLDIKNFILEFPSEAGKRYNYIHEKDPYLIVNIAYEEAN